MKTKVCLLTLLFLNSVAMLHAQAVFSFEGGLDGWTTSGFNAKPASLGVSPTGATDGAQALFITQTGDGFSWNASRTSSNATPDAFYAAMNTAAANESLWTLEFDVTYVNVEIPDAGFLNLSLWINSDNGFRDIHGLGTTSTLADETRHVTIPFSSFSGGPDTLATSSSFYQMGIAMNGNWGSGDATIHVDKIQVVPEPSTGLLVLASLFVVFAARRRHNQNVA